MEAEILFNKILEALMSEFGGVKEGNMMRSRALTKEDKVFAFLSKKNHMVFKLGKTYHTNDDEIVEFNPFKNKGPLKGWFQVPAEKSYLWKEFSLLALKKVNDET